MSAESTALPTSAAEIDLRANRDARIVLFLFGDDGGAAQT